MIGDELFRGRHRVVAEIVMPGAGHAHEALGRPDQAIQPLAERYGNNSVVLAVHHQHWCRDLADAQIRAKWSFMKSRTGTNQ